MGDFPLESQTERSPSADLTHNVGKRSVGQSRQDKVRAARAGNTALGVFTKHETRITAFPVARLIPVGTEALQSFFSAPSCLAWGMRG